MIEHRSNHRGYCVKNIGSLATAIAIVAILAASASAKKCPDDSVQVGPACVDKYEASVYSTTDSSLVKRIQKGKARSASDLVGAVQHGVGFDDYGTGCPDDAAGCTDYYAVSIPNNLPSTYITWFQAQAACRNAGKRLASNAEWQAAAYGTPDPGTDNGTTDCNVSSVFVPLPTGSRSGCVSDVGAFDMVGNLFEWVADWADRAASGCTDWTTETGIAGGDFSCFGGDGSVAANRVPGALLRGGANADGAMAGVFTVVSLQTPLATGLTYDVGMRCAR
jgi:Sulfatase-modifying factor enzyme 1